MCAASVVDEAVYLAIFSVGQCERASFFSRSCASVHYGGSKRKYLPAKHYEVSDFISRFLTFVLVFRDANVDTRFRGTLK